MNQQETRDSINKDLSEPYSHAPMVYAVWNGSHIKIGFSTKFNTRLKALQGGCPTKLMAIAVRYGHEGTEQKYHELLKDHRVEGEWFTLHTDVLNHVDWMAAQGIGPGSVAITGVDRTLKNPLDNNKNVNPLTVIGDLLHTAEQELANSINWVVDRTRVYKRLAEAGIHIRDEDSHLTAAKLVIQQAVFRRYMGNLRKTFKGKEVPTQMELQSFLKVIEVISPHKNGSTYRFPNLDKAGHAILLRGVHVDMALVLKMLKNAGESYSFANTLGTIWERSNPDDDEPTPYEDPPPK
jgi:hypothetical protein